MQFRRGQDCLFTIEEFLSGVRLILDEPTARRVVFEWLDLFGFRVVGDCVVEPAGGWEEYGGADGDARVAGSIHQFDPASEFAKSLHGQPMATDLTPLNRAMFVRYSDMHHVLVAMAVPAAVERFSAAGVDLPGLPSTAVEHEEFLGAIRRMIGMQ